MSILSKIMNKIEDVVIKRRRWILIPNSEIKLFYIDIAPYKGVIRTLKDGTTIQTGDLVGEFHMNNRLVPEVTFKNVLRFEKQIDMEMRTLAKAFNQENLMEIKAFFARTVLYPVIKRLDFEVFEIENPIFRSFLSCWDFLIMKAYSKSKLKKKLRKTQEVWISSLKMIERLENRNEK